jgi:hypothetical protein
MLVWTVNRVVGIVRPLRRAAKAHLLEDIIHLRSETDAPCGAL